ncbi:LysR family transcriptional regulator [Pseudomonas petrae]|uniref:LysR family transcriptional regulator n=1 Tax=Pseudomonas petrae TaxID=2912190 RepID=A0ABS9I296_9PSED|nr:LysR family transcriptional regulator [Pseudomonas petrae]MCF7541660.1 LysR family transcriptional regulator [Pseudomonas petrae]
MTRYDLRKVDFSLLIIFETLMQEHNLTLAGEKLFMCQSAIGVAVSRLRQLFDDPLFVRLGKTLEPTIKATEILQNLTPVINTMAAVLRNAGDFDPETRSPFFKTGFSGNLANAAFDSSHPSFYVK